MLLILLNGFALSTDEKPYAGVTPRIATTKFPFVEAWLPYAEEVAKEMGMNLEVSWFTAEGVESKMGSFFARSEIHYYL